MQRNSTRNRRNETLNVILQPPGEESRRDEGKAAVDSQLLKGKDLCSGELNISLTLLTGIEIERFTPWKVMIKGVNVSVLLMVEGLYDNSQLRSVKSSETT